MAVKKPCGGGQSVAMHGSKLQAPAGRKERQGAKGTFGQKCGEYDDLRMGRNCWMERSDLGRVSAAAISKKVEQ
jgi:hypothetical protein